MQHVIYCKITKAAQMEEDKKTLVGPSACSCRSAQPVSIVTKARWYCLAWDWYLPWKAWSKQRYDYQILFMEKMYSTQELIYHYWRVWMQVCQLSTLAPFATPKVPFLWLRKHIKCFQALFGFAFKIPHIHCCWKYSKSNVKTLVFSCNFPLSFLLWIEH